MQPVQKGLSYTGFVHAELQSNISAFFLRVDSLPSTQENSVQESCFLEAFRRKYGDVDPQEYAKLRACYVNYAISQITEKSLFQWNLNRRNSEPKLISVLDPQALRDHCDRLATHLYQAILRDFQGVPFVSELTKKEIVAQVQESTERLLQRELSRQLRKLTQECSSLERVQYQLREMGFEGSCIEKLLQTKQSPIPFLPSACIEELSSSAIQTEGGTQKQLPLPHSQEGMDLYVKHACCMWGPELLLKESKPDDRFRRDVQGHLDGPDLEKALCCLEERIRAELQRKFPLESEPYVKELSCKVREGVDLFYWQIIENRCLQLVKRQYLTDCLDRNTIITGSHQWPARSIETLENSIMALLEKGFAKSTLLKYQEQIQMRIFRQYFLSRADCLYKYMVLLRSRDPVEEVYTQISYDLEQQWLGEIADRQFAEKSGKELPKISFKTKCFCEKLAGDVKACLEEKALRRKEELSVGVDSFGGDRRAILYNVDLFCRKWVALKPEKSLSGVIFLKKVKKALEKRKFVLTPALELEVIARLKEREQERIENFNHLSKVEVIGDDCWVDVASEFRDFEEEKFVENEWVIVDASDGPSSEGGNNWDEI